MRRLRSVPFCVFLLAAGCTRDPGDAVCPDLAAGDLVVTEVRGPQTGDDLAKPYVELFNASSGTIDLLGTKIRFRKKDGSSEVPVLVRRSVTLPAGGYAVLGLESDTARSAYVDYGFAGDFMVGFLTSAFVDVETCGALIDRMQYDSLPRTGSYSLGTLPPTADANDIPANWCTATAGSPQQANAACP